MKINAEGIALIKRWESFKTKAYICPAGVPSIGYGTTIYPNGRRVTLKDAPITEAVAHTYMMHDIDRMSRQIIPMLQVKLNENRFSALVSFAYNLGTGALRRSTLLKVINAAPGVPGIRTEFMKWVNATDPSTGLRRPLPGLVSRRKMEADLYFKV